MSKVNLKNKVILVTGAAGFIGAALCKRLLEAEEAGGFALWYREYYLVQDT